MKTRKNLIGIIATVAIITIGLIATLTALSLTGCDNNNEPEHKHSWGDWKTNETQHWKECDCGKKNETANHTFDGNGVCICGYEQQKDWTGEDINLSFTNATVGGINLTATEWNGVHNKVKTVINEIINNAPSEPVRDMLKNRYAKCEYIFVEKTTVYPTWKTIGDGNTIYINFGVLDNEDLPTIINVAIGSMNSNKEEQGE
jgi:hypothetical protein